MANGQLTYILHQLRRLIGPQKADHESDGRLLTRFASSRDEAAFEELVRRHGPMVFDVCQRELGEASDADDAFQATFLVLARRAAAIRKRESVGSWLFGVARRVARKAKGTLARRRARESQVNDMISANPPAETHELRPLLDAELECLPDRYRAPLVLCYLEGKTHEQAARELGCPVGSISWRLEKGCALLRNRLTRRGVALPAAGLGLLLGTSAAPAAVSAGLVHATVQSAAPFAAGNLAAVEAASAQAVALAQGVLKLMLIAKLTAGVSVLVLVAVVGVIAGAGVLAAQRTTPAGPPEVVQQGDSDSPEAAPVTREVEVAKIPVEPPPDEEPMRPVADVGATQVEFVRALRAKGYLDLALDYLAMLEKNAPADLAPLLALEKANVRVDLAADQPDPQRRAQLLDGARAEFQAVSKRSPGQPVAAIAQLEKARILGLQCRTAFARVPYLAPAAQIQEANRIEQLAVQAMTELEKVGDEIDRQMKKKNLAPMMEKALDEARLLADLELAINLIDRAVTHAPQNKNLQAAGKQIEKAIRDLRGVPGQDPKGAVGPMARAWLIKAYSEIDQIKEAKQAYDQAKQVYDLIIGDNSPRADNARRVAQYFYFMMLAGDRNLNPIGIKAADAPREAQALGEAWIRSYSAHLNSVEGLSLRFALANSYMGEGLRQPKTDAAARALLEKALRLYNHLAETDFGKEAQENKARIIAHLAE